MIRKIAPVLNTYSISETNLFYRNKLKFATQNFGNYLVVAKDNVEIHYVEWTGKNNFIPASCYLLVDNVEDLFAKFSSMDVVNPKGSLKNNGRGNKEFHVMDNNGNVLKFGEM